jgi:Flp pilus assembly protein TadG
MTEPLKSRRQEGQALVEFALIIPIFLLVVVGLFDAGRLVYTNSALSQAAREGARLAATEASWISVPGTSCVADPSGITSARPGAHVCPVDVTSFKAHVTSAVNRMAVSLGPLAAVHISCNDGGAGDPAPTGAWTETSGGNGCRDGAGNPISVAGDVVSVRIEFGYAPMTPVIGSIIGSVPLSGSATMVIN